MNATILATLEGGNNAGAAGLVGEYLDTSERALMTALARLG